MLRWRFALKTVDGITVNREDLISIKRVDGKLRLFYVTNPDGRDYFYGYRVNRDFSINLRDKRRQTAKCFSYYKSDEIRIIDPVPDDFKEAVRTLHFWTEDVLEDFGAIRYAKSYALLRAVKFQNGSYGIIQNRLYRDLMGIDREYECQNLLEDLTYEALLEKWEKRKKNCDAEWLPNFSAW